MEAEYSLLIYFYILFNDFIFRGLTFSGGVSASADYYKQSSS